MILSGITLIMLSACGKSQEAAPPPPPPPPAPVAAPAAPPPAITTQEPMAPAVPPPGDAKMEQRAAAKAEARPAAKAASGTYTIAKGDTLYVIARKNGVKVNDLIRWNNIRNVKRLKPGQVLKLSGG
jgi:nucleoid-associated protein YgaU